MESTSLSNSLEGVSPLNSWAFCRTARFSVNKHSNKNRPLIVKPHTANMLKKTVINSPIFKFIFIFEFTCLLYLYDYFNCVLSKYLVFLMMPYYFKTHVLCTPGSLKLRTQVKKNPKLMKMLSKECNKKMQFVICKM